MVQVSSRAGAYSKEVSSRHLFSLCPQAAKNRLTVAQIKGAVYYLMPKNTNVTRQQVFNLRFKITRLLPTSNKKPDYAAAVPNVCFEGQKLSCSGSHTELTPDKLNVESSSC